MSEAPRDVFTEDLARSRGRRRGPAPNSVLDTAAALVAQALDAAGRALAGPVLTQFPTDARCSTRVQVDARLANADPACAAAAIVRERFGDNTDMGVINVR
jgi:hypothetical protein